MAQKQKKQFFCVPKAYMNVMKNKREKRMREERGKGWTANNWVGLSA
jgi:hypothetical protein